MNNSEEFIKNGHKLIDWLHYYFDNIENYPIKSKVKQGEIETFLPDSAPVTGEAFDKIFEDFEKIIMPGITHWQHPGFHAFFPANNSQPSILAEILTAGLGIQGMKWITSPSSTELERVMMKWLAKMIGLPDNFSGVIMDTASVSNLCAILAARELKANYQINASGFEKRILRVYCSGEAHSSVEKAVMIAGIGSQNLVKIPVDEELRMIPEELEENIKSDINNGYIPACIVGAIGTTGTGAIDPIEVIARIAKKYNIWFHIDAAYSGSALILPEFRETISGIGLADSFVFNPHKWLFVNFDCSAFYVRDSSMLVNTFSLVPEYLKSEQSDEEDYNNWGIQLGRRFRSLKLWFVIRSFGLEGLQKRIRYHIDLGRKFEKFVLDDKNFELIVPRKLNIVCFRYLPDKKTDINTANKKLLDNINNTGKVFLSHTKVNGNFVIRFVCGQTNVEERHINTAWNVIKQCSVELSL